MGGDIAEVSIMRVLRAIVQELLLGNLVDKEVQGDADEDPLVDWFADHVIELVVDTMQLLKALKVACSGGRVRNGPKTQVMHVSQHAPAMLERNFHSIFLTLIVCVDIFRLAHVSHVSGFITEVLCRRFEVR